MKKHLSSTTIIKIVGNLYDDISIKNPVYYNGIGICQLHSLFIMANYDNIMSYSLYFLIISALLILFLFLYLFCKDLVVLALRSATQTSKKKYYSEYVKPTVRTSYFHYFVLTFPVKHIHCIIDKHTIYCSNSIFSKPEFSACFILRK